MTYEENQMDDLITGGLIKAHEDSLTIEEILRFSDVSPSEEDAILAAFKAKEDQIKLLLEEKAKLIDEVNGYRESLKAHLQHSIEMQECGQQEENNAGVEEGILYAIKMLDKHNLTSPQKIRNAAHTQMKGRRF